MAEHCKELEIYKTLPNNNPIHPTIYSPWLDLSGPRAAYSQKIFRPVTQFNNFLHKNGQRKLLVSELFFLTLAVSKFPDSQVLYIGAAPGKHINLLRELFPKTVFHLYDPNPFDPELRRCSQQKIGAPLFLYNQLFEDSDCVQFEQIQTILISDIRSCTDYVNKDQGVVEKEMELEESWVEMVKPCMFSLKFKLNWDKEFETCLKGFIYLQSWTGPWSIETRLIGYGADGYEKMKYNCKEYEEVMFYFNTNTRFEKQCINIGDDMVYEQLTPKPYCNCRDCTNELHAIEEYVESDIAEVATVEDVRKMIMENLIIKLDIDKPSLARKKNKEEIGTFDVDDED